MGLRVEVSTGLAAFLGLAFEIAFLLGAGTAETFLGSLFVVFFYSVLVLAI